MWGGQYQQKPPLPPPDLYVLYVPEGMHVGERGMDKCCVPTNSVLLHTDMAQVYTLYNVLG